MSMSPCHLDRFSPEFQLACHCCRVEPPLARMADLLQRVDVPVFVNLVLARHRIGPLAHAALKRLPAADFPPGLLEALAQATRANAIQALRAQRTLLLLARWFADAGIDWMPFKGLTLAQHAYGDLTLRHVNDLDIWVPRHELQRARTVLQQQGFHFDVELRHWDLAARGPRHRDYLLRYYHEEHHASSEFGLLELHWRLTSSASLFRLTPQELLARAQQLECGGVALRMMDDTDLLLYLCEHGGRHGWYRLKWLADLPRMLTLRDWDWPQVLARARSLGCARSLLLGLALAEDLFGWLPLEIVRDEEQRMCSQDFLRGVVARSLQAPGSDYAAGMNPTLTWRMRDLAKALLFSPSPGAVAEQLWRRALSPNDLRVLQVPDRWFGLYYLLRPLLFALRYRRGTAQIH